MLLAPPVDGPIRGNWTPISNLAFPYGRLTLTKGQISWQRCKRVPYRAKKHGKNIALTIRIDRPCAAFARGQNVLLIHRSGKAADVKVYRGAIDPKRLYLEFAMTR